MSSACPRQPGFNVPTIGRHPVDTLKAGLKPSRQNRKLIDEPIEYCDFGDGLISASPATPISNLRLV